MEIIKRLSEVLYAAVIIAGLAGCIRSIFSGKINNIFWIILACIVMMVFISNPQLFVSLVEQIINFVKSIVDTASTE